MPQLDANRNASRKAVKRATRKPKIKPPTKTRIKQANAQQQQYVSQGRAVEKAGNEQRKVRVARQKATAKTVTRAGDNKSDADRARGQDYVRKQYVKTYGTKRAKKFYREGTTVPPQEAAYQRIRNEQKGEEVSRANTAAPVLKVLEQTTRPLHAVAAVERSAIKSLKTSGRIDPIKALKAAGRGAANKDKSTYSDVLGDLGVKNKTVKTVGGFVGDVLGDPLTYVTGGTGSIARRQAVKEAERVAKKTVGKTTPLREPTTAKEAGRAKTRAAGGGGGDAPTLAERAHARKLRTGDQTQGVTAKFAGGELPGVRKATAAASKPVRKVARKVVPQRVRNAARGLAADVNPNIAPVGVSRADHEAATRAIRVARAKTNHGTADALKEAQAIRKKVGEKNYATIIDAIESGSLKGLSDDLHKAAVVIRSRLRHANRVRKQAGIKGGERKNYVPRERTAESLAAEGKADGRGSGSKTIRPSYEKARTETRPMSVLRNEEPGKYSEDLASLHLHRMSKGKQDVAKADLNRRLADMGRTIRKPGDIRLKDGEGVFHIKGSDIREVTDPKELERLADEGGKTGRYVVLSSDVVKRATEGVSPQLKGGGIVNAFDKATGGFKTVATATLGFHIRNFLGDTQNHYLGASGHKIPANMVQSGRVLKAAGRKDKALRNLDPNGKTGSGTLKTKRYGNVTYDEVARNLAGAGAYRSGYTARELPDLLKSGSKGPKVRRVRLPEKVKTAALNREDLPRVATAVDQLKKGATWEEAAQKVADLHFDYQHLTSFERNIARRVMPFYTFSARNIPLQAKTLVTKPGKYANYQKIREEAGKATGVDERDQKTKDLYRQLNDSGVRLPQQWEAMLSEWEQRNAGVPIKWKGHKFTLSFGLPLQDLGEFPGAAGSKQTDEYFKKFMSMTNPLMKDPVEFFNNFSFFFRDQIERENAPLVAAPDIVGTLPESLRNQLGITKINDKKHPDRKVWAWPAKTDYIAKSVPGTPQYLQQLLTSGTDRRGKGTAGKVLAYSGLKSVPLDPVANAVSLTYDREHEIKLQLGKLDQQGVDAKHPNAAYEKLNGQLKILKNIRAEAHLTDPQKAHLLVKANDDLLKTVTKKAKVKKTSDNFYYTKEYQGLLDREKTLRQQIKDLTGAQAPKSSVRLSRRPLTLRQQLEKERDKLRGGGLREELTRQLERERAKTDIVASGG